MKLAKIKQEDLEVGKQVYIIGYIKQTGKQPKLVRRKYILTSEDVLNPKLTFYGENQGRVKTVSKHYYDDEIKCKLPDGSIYLKLGVKRKHYNDDLDYDSMQQFIQTDPLLNVANKTKKILEEEKNYN